MVFCRFLIILTFILSLSPGAAYSQFADANLDVKRINNCVYEVIIPKPADDSITYEKPLPMDLLPFQTRNDKYYPVGTAFACNRNEFITAGHVLNLGIKSQFKEVFLRDVKGNVFSVDKIVKFSSRRDFVLFTVKERQSPDYLEPNLAPAIGDKVFAVGNALGQGVVIRDGLYTSTTPEEVDGKWNWIRFSAAASPGNSGGPLLDKDGKVVGVVLSKSQNENLNYALPVSEIDRDYGNNAEIFHKITHLLEIFDFVKTATLDTNIKLPMVYADFNQAYIGKMNEFNGALRKDLLSENKANTFPNGSGSIRMMYTSSINSFPQIITRREDGNWEAGLPQNISRAELDNNGRIGYGAWKYTSFAKIEKPDNISVKDLCTDSKLLMDMLLKAININRTIGPEKIRIVSLGKADNGYTHSDSWGRKWLVKTWPIGYCDQEIATFILPAPDGCVVLIKTGQTGQVLDDYIEDLKVLADFVNISYGATLDLWREFLELKDFIPSALSGIEIKPGVDSFHYKSGRFKASCNPSLMQISDKSVLALGFGFYKDKDAFVWDVSKMVLTEGKFDKNGFGVTRHVKPMDNSEKYADFWQRLAEGKKPFDKQISIKDDNTGISDVYKIPEAAGTADCAVLYDVSHMKRGVIAQDEMESGLDRFMKEIAVYER
ncbi:MAG: trypsin-like peptidase domain-containing protein [Syntrophobacteraceae bacterium]